MVDYSKGNTGSFLSWGIKFLVQEAEKEELKREIFPWLIIPDSYPAGIESRIEIERPGKILKLEVSLEITHSSIGDLKAELVMPSGEKLTLLNRMESGRKKFKETFSTETDENLRPAISKEMQGVWTLRIADLAEKHEGTLDNWGLHFIYEIDPESLQ